MKLENKSAFHRNQKLYPLIDFVASQTRFSDLATLRVLDIKDVTKKTGGLASKHRPDASPLLLIAPSIIQMTVSRGLTYPLTTLHVEEVGPVQLRSWEEEFLFVLAHEARHVDQFWGTTFDDERAAEVDAERFAKQVLGRWRRASRLTPAPLKAAA